MSWSVAPAQTGPLLPAAGADGIGLTVVVAVDELFADEGSLTADETDAVLTAEPAADGALIVIVIAGAAPTAREGRVQVTVVVPPQLHPVPEAETSAAPVGRTSETDTDVAVEGPALETLSV